MLKIEAIAQGATVCNFFTCPHLKLVALGNRAAVSSEPWICERIWLHTVLSGKQFLYCKHRIYLVMRSIFIFQFIGQFIARAVADDCLPPKFVTNYRGKVDRTNAL